MPFCVSANKNHEGPTENRLGELGSLYKYYYYGSTNVWMPRVKIKSPGWAANRNQLQHRLKFVVAITQ